MIWLNVALGPENLAHHPEERLLQVTGKGWHRQARDDVVGLADPPVGEDRGQVADIALDNVEAGTARESLMEQAAKVRVALQDHNAATRQGFGGKNAGDRARPAPSSTITRAAVQSMFRTVDARATGCSEPGWRWQFPV